MKKRSKQTLEEKLLNLEQELKVPIAPYHDQNFTLTYDLEMPSQTKNGRRIFKRFRKVLFENKERKFVKVNETEKASIRK